MGRAISPEVDEDVLRLFTEIMVRHLDAMQPGETFHAPDVIAAFVARQPDGAVPATLECQLRTLASAVYELAKASVADDRSD